MCEARDYVCRGSSGSEPWDVHTTCVCGFDLLTIWERDGDWICGELFINDVRTIRDEMTGCAGVAERRRGVRCMWSVVGEAVGFIDVVVVACFVGSKRCIIIVM